MGYKWLITGLQPNYRNYKPLIINTKSPHLIITKKENKLLDDELFKKYCKCIKTIKRSKNKSPKSYFDKYGICMNSLYKNRKFKPPYNVSKKCNIFYS